MEPTSAKTFEDLIIRVAQRLGVAYYGENQDEAPQMPVNAYDLALCKQYVNDGIRMVIDDAPPAGWGWQRLTASIVLWPDVETDDDVTITATNLPSENRTLVTCTDDVFYPSMEDHAIVVTDVDTYTIERYVSATSIKLEGQHAWSGSATFSIVSNGNFTLPRTFGGSHRGKITYAAGTNAGVSLIWSTESQIRLNRENTTADTGYPELAAIRLRENRRWELLTYPTPSNVLTVEFPYSLYFDDLVDPDDTHPAGYEFDGVIIAACLAVAEREEEDNPMGPFSMRYVNRKLPNAYTINARSAPQRLARSDTYGATISEFRRISTREDVTFNT